MSLNQNSFLFLENSDIFRSIVTVTHISFLGFPNTLSFSYIFSYHRYLSYSSCRQIETEEESGYYSIYSRDFGFAYSTRVQI